MNARTVAALIAVVALALGASWWLARDGGESTTPFEDARPPADPDPGDAGHASAPDPDPAPVPEPETEPPPPEPVPHGSPHPPDGIVVPDFSMDNADGENALAYVAEACGLELVISDAARPKVEDMQVSFQFENIKASTILDLVTEPYGLVWQVKGDQLIIEDGEG